IFQKGPRGENVLDMSNRLISKYGLENLFDCSLVELQKIKGIGKAKAMQLLAMAELGRRYSQAKRPIIKVTSAKDVFDYFYEKLKDEKQENFYVLLLRTDNSIIKGQLITKGVLDSAILHPREVFKPAIKNSASKIIIVHNHPSGNPKPSGEDIEVTKRLIESGKTVDIKILDHVIIGRKNRINIVEGNNKESLEENKNIENKVMVKDSDGAMIKDNKGIMVKSSKVSNEKNYWSWVEDG
ncbi:MAG: RadC family protein, partial [Minisyncoccales bacterium]